MSIKVNGKTLEAQNGERLMDVLIKNRMSVDFQCGGMKKCGKCKVRLLGGEEISDAERALLTEKEVGQGIRLACFLRVQSGMEVDLPQSAAAKIETGYSEQSGKFEPMGTGYGIAIDIGTTTIAMYLADLSDGAVLGTASGVNRQKTAGEDVISRISYTMEHSDGMAYLQNILLTQLNAMLRDLIGRYGVAQEEISAVVISANTVITHFLLGLETRSIAMAPFTPLFTNLLITGKRKIPLNVSERADIVVMPCVSGYVGGDIVAGVLDTGLYENEELSLLIDIGTNGEMALGNKHRICCCSVAAGPAFEGGHIECGVGGVTAAIDSFQIHDGKVRYTTIGNAAVPIGMCGSGVLDVTAALLNERLIDETGYLEETYHIAEDVYLTARDVREIQLAKAAVAAGIASLLRYYGAELEQISTVYLAGGFGSYMRVESAVRIGMIPKELALRVKNVGNSSGSGALRILRNKQAIETAGQLKEKMEYLELSDYKFFQDEFISRMEFDNFSAKN